MTKRFGVVAVLLSGFFLFLCGSFTSAKGACRDCTGDAPVLDGFVIEEDCNCTGNTSLTIGPDLTVKDGVTVTFVSPMIRIKPRTVFEEGAMVELLSLIEPISITLNADPADIPADESSTSTVTAEVKDGDGNPIPRGVSVTFETTLGTFNNDDQTYTLETPDNTGAINVVLYAGTTAGTATITATLGSTTEQVLVTFENDSTPASIVLAAYPDTLTANGNSTSEIEAYVMDADYHPVSDGTSVSFAVTRGTGTVSPSSVTTRDGYADVIYTASTTAGTETVRATTTNGISKTVDITLTG